MIDDVLFWNKVKFGPGCWVWTGGRTATGYGRVKRGGKMVCATHWAVFLTIGRLPVSKDGEVVAHSCDNPPCVRPDHLRVCSQSENIAECISKGRWTPPNPTKLSDSDKKEMVKMRLDGSTFREIGERFGIKISTAQKWVSASGCVNRRRSI